MDKIDRSRNYFKNLMIKEGKIFYFQSSLKIELDSQFDKINNYFNNVIKPTLDSINNSILQGVYGKSNTFLTNYYNEEVEWLDLNIDTFEDNTIKISKFKKQTIGSLLLVNADGNVDVSKANNDNQVLISRDNNMPIWQLITSNHIEPKTLTGSQLGVLSMENFVANQFVTNITAGVITTDKIKDLNITNDKLADGSITSDKLGIFANLPVVTNGLTVNHIEDGAITPDKIKDNTIPVSYNNYLGSMFDWIWGNVYGKVTAEGGWVYKQLLKSENLKDNSIEDSLFSKILFKPNDTPQADRVEAAKAFFPDVPLAFQFTANHIAPNSLDLDSFDNEVKAALNRL